MQPDQLLQSFSHWLRQLQQIQQGILEITVFLTMVCHFYSIVNEHYYFWNTQNQKVVLVTGQVQVPVHHREGCKLVGVPLVQLVHLVAKNIIRTIYSYSKKVTNKQKNVQNNCFLLSLLMNTHFCKSQHFIYDWSKWCLTIKPTSIKQAFSDNQSIKSLKFKITVL